MPLPTNATASFSNRINNRYLHIFLQHLCQNNLALTSQTFCPTFNLSIIPCPAPGRHKILFFSIDAEEKFVAKFFFCLHMWFTFPLEDCVSSMSSRSSSLFLSPIYCLSDSYSTSGTALCTKRQLQ